MSVLAATGASAQVFGTFSWQMQPFCNVVTMTITQIPSGFTIDGHDEQCAAIKRASSVGMALINPDGTVGLNFTIVTAPGGKGVSVAAVISPVTGSGSWTDSVGNSGTFVLSGAMAGLPPRPTPASGIGPSTITSIEIAPAAVGVTQVNTTQVQARVTGTCPAGQAVTGVNANGTVVCASSQAQVQFRAVAHGTITVPVGALTDVTGWSSVYNDGGGTFNSASGVYVVPVTGLYEISSIVRWTDFTAGGTGFAGLYVDVNGTFVETTTIAPSTTNDFNLHQVSSTRKLTAGSSVKIRVYQTTGGPVTLGPGASSQSSFTVTQLR